MYLKQLYTRNKWWCVLAIIFIVMQLGINYKRGVVCSPFYHYGMYSAVILPQKKYTVNEIRVNGKQLSPANFSPYQWDKINNTLDEYNTQQEWNSWVWNNEIKRLMHIKDSSAYVNNLSSQEFNDWYKNYLECVTGSRVDSLSITTNTYIFNGNTLQKQP